MVETYFQVLLQKRHYSVIKANVRLLKDCLSKLAIAIVAELRLFKDELEFLCIYKFFYFSLVQAIQSTFASLESYLKF